MPGRTLSKISTIDAQCHLALRALPMVIMAALALPARAASPAAIDPAVDPAANGAVSFDSNFFSSGQASKIDLSRFEKEGYVLPGTYSTDIYVNRVWMERSDVTFEMVPDNDKTQPCYTATALTRYGIDLKKLGAALEQPRKPISEGRFCGNLADYVPGATASFDGSSQSLTLEVPQIYTLRNARGYVDPSQWEAGINAAVIGYSANFYHTDGRSSQNNGYLGLNLSQNLGSWHFDHQGSMTWTQRGGTHYQPSATYLQHDFPSLKAQMIVGDSFTPGDLFDSVRLRGVRLYTDDRMYPWSQRGFAPVVRGVADTNAHVVVRQMGYVVYDTNVAPGPFSIDDINPTGYGGNLDVEVIEADGRVKRFSVPYAAVPQLLRPGQSRWSIAAGQVRQLNLIDQPNILQGTYQYGVSNRWTAYGGATAGTDYGALLAGAALNTPFGAFVADITGTRNRVPTQKATQGASFRLSYSENLVSTGTNFGLAAYRYSTGGYVGVGDAAALRDAWARGYDTGLVPRQRNRLDVNISQTLSGRGQLFVQGSLANYWSGLGRQLSYSAGYSNAWGPASYSVSVQRTRNSSLDNQTFAGRIPGDIFAATNTPSVLGYTDTSVMLSVTLPLGHAARVPQLGAYMSHSRQTGTNTQANLTGTYGADQRLSYGLNLGHSDAGTTEGINGQYNGIHTNVMANYSHGPSYSQTGAGLSGSLLLHAGGFTFSPPTGDTIGLIHAPGAKGARVQPGQGSVVDGNGYAVVPYLMPYQRNAITLDPKNASNSVDIASTEERVAPRAGSVVLVDFKTSTGRALLIDTRTPDGRPIPFGADVLDHEGNSIGVAGQASQLYIRNMQTSGVITVKWGDGEADECQVNVQIPPASSADHGAMKTITAACQAPAKVSSRSSSGTSDGRAWGRLDVEHSIPGKESAESSAKVQP